MSARRLWALSVLADRPADPDATTRLPAVKPARRLDECRTQVDGQRCGHSPDDHYQSGFYPGEKWRCRGCGCRGFRWPWRAHAQEALAYLAVLALIVLFWAAL